MEWTADNTVVNLIPRFAANCKLRDGSLVRVYTFGGKWGTLSEQREETYGYSLPQLAAWLNEHGAEPIR